MGELISVEEAAKMLGLKEQRVQDKLKAGLKNPDKLGVLIGHKPEGGRRWEVEKDSVLRLKGVAVIPETVKEVNNELEDINKAIVVKEARIKSLRLDDEETALLAKMKATAEGYQAEKKALKDGIEQLKADRDAFEAVKLGDAKRLEAEKAAFETMKADAEAQLKDEAEQLAADRVKVEADIDKKRADVGKQEAKTRDEVREEVDNELKAEWEKLGAKGVWLEDARKAFNEQERKQRKEADKRTADLNDRDNALKSEEKLVTDKRYAVGECLNLFKLTLPTLPDLSNKEQQARIRAMIEEGNKLMARWY